MTSASDFKVESVFVLPPGHYAGAMTADGHVVSIGALSDGRTTLGWDGHADLPPFDGFATMRDNSAATAASPNGAHLAYVGLRAGHVFVGRDGAEEPPIPGFSRSVPPVFSYDGRHLAYGSLDGDDARLIVDGQPVGGPLAPIGAVFSPDGERLAYVEMRGSTRSDVEYRVVLDGHAGEWISGLRNAGGVMQFSSDSRRFAYCRGGGGNVQWVVDGVSQQEYREVRSVGLAQVRGVGVIEPPLNARFSPDGRRFAYFADVPEKGVAVVEDGIAGPVLKAVGQIVFSPDSRRLAYVGQRFDGQLCLVLDGASGPTWDGKDAGLPVFSPDSRRLAVVIERQMGGILRRRKRYGLVVDGRVVAETGGDDASLSPVFSPDANHVAWWVAHGTSAQMWLDDQPHAGGELSMGEPFFTPAGSLAYAMSPAGPDKATVSVAGIPGPIATGLATNRTVHEHFGKSNGPRPLFSMSPDSESVAWIGQFGAEIRPVLDHLVGPAFDKAVTYGFDEHGRVSWWFQSGNQVVRVTH